jgi:signal transduction histidine kinase
MQRGGGRALPDRATVDRALDQLGRVRGQAGVAAALEGAGEMTAVLNGERRVVFANRAFLDFAAAADPEELCGKRTGEIFGCAHATLAAEGCGASDACSFCGAAGAVRETQRTGRAVTSEYRVDSRLAGRQNLLELQVRTTPFEIGGEVFTLLALADVSHQKRRAALERVFFHDILNTASGLKAYLDLLKSAELDARSREIVTRLESIGAALIEEIQGQKVLVSAENRTLTVRKDLIESLALVRQLVEQFEGQDAAAGRLVSVAPSSESVAFVSDDSLVRRVLANMLKNALEATPKGAAVSIGCRRVREGERDGVRFHVHNPSAMPPEVSEQVFRRYFTTKGADRGLGTWGMKLLGEEYLGGEVGFSSTGAEGTEFYLLLPDRPPESAGSPGSRRP